MTSGQKLLNATINTFPVVKLMCEASAEEKSNLEATLGLLPEKMVDRMIRDNEVILDQDGFVDKDGVYAYIMGPQSDLNSNRGILRMEYKGLVFGSNMTTTLEIVCDARPTRGGAPCEVLKYFVMDHTHKPKYRTVSVSLDQNGNASVSEELSNSRSIRSFTRSEYRNSYENE